MSKMLAKKKSCFQITSVTQAQVAASTITDDTESLDDPDESRTEDVSSEIFDVSRADLDACERSSSEETLNNVGDPQEGTPHAAGPFNGVLPYPSISAGLVTPLNSGGSTPLPTKAQPFVPAIHPLTVISSPSAASVSPGAAHTVPVSTSCSSRFRVIKLDHGTGEPFRRGRWTCTEFYERDSDSNASRTLDGIKPAMTLDHSIDRDSGLGATINSMLNSTVVSTQASENPTDSGYFLSLGSKLGSGTSAFQPTGYSATSTLMGTQANANIQPVAPQNFHSNGHGLHHGVVQTSPIMSPATQTQHRQQHFGSSALQSGLTPSQVPSSPITSGSPGAQGLSGEAGSAQGLLLQGGNAPVVTSILQANDQQQRTSPAQPLGGIGATLVTAVTTSTSHSNGENAPATVPNTTATSLGGGPLQPQGTYGGIAQGLPSGFLMEDIKHRSDFLPQFGANMMSGRDHVKPFISDGLDLPTPSVKSLFGISIAMNVDEDSASGASVVAIDNKIEQAMDLVKSHLMYAVREEVEVLKEHIKELYERNSVLERENAVLKSLANSEQLGKLSSQLVHSSSPTLQPQQPPAIAPLSQPEGSQTIRHQPNITSA
eukprot:XP_011613223.1 PREDICTED: TSC22 domain family protein 2-like [Takifugu rubripes]